jgi:nucleoside-diphosphate-sugar epimerase
MSIQTVLVAGATGNLGFKTTLALLESKKFKEVRALVRPSTLQGDQKKDKIEQLKTKGAIIKEGDADDVNSLIAAFQGVDAVISTASPNDFVVSHSMIHVMSHSKIQKAQLNLLEASKAAGVKRFIPSEFSQDDETKTGYIFCYYDVSVPY